MADLIITLKGIKFNVCFYSNDVLRKECDKSESFKWDNNKEFKTE